MNGVMSRVRACVAAMGVAVVAAPSAWAVQSDGSLGANFIAALVNAATQVWLPAILSIGFVVVVFLMLFGRGGQFIQKFGFWILAIIAVGGGFVYFSGFSGGTVTMTAVLRML